MAASSIALSISCGKCLIPLMMMLSFTRPERLRFPAVSRQPLSPVMNQPSWVKDWVVAVGLLKYSLKTTGPETSRFPTVRVKIVSIVHFSGFHDLVAKHYLTRKLRI